MKVKMASFLEPVTLFNTIRGVRTLVESSQGCQGLKMDLLANGGLAVEQKGKKAVIFRKDAIFTLDTDEAPPQKVMKPKPVGAAPTPPTE